MRILRCLRGRNVAPLAHLLRLLRLLISWLLGYWIIGLGLMGVRRGYARPSRGWLTMLHRVLSRRLNRCWLRLKRLSRHWSYWSLRRRHRRLRVRCDWNWRRNRYGLVLLRAHIRRPRDGCRRRIYWCWSVHFQFPHLIARHYGCQNPKTPLSVPLFF